MSALLPGFTRRRVQTGEVAPHAADGGDGPLPCGHFLAEQRPGEVVGALQGFVA